MGKVIKPTFDEEELVLHIGDVHYGEVVKSEYNMYNTAIARARMQYYFDTVLKIARGIYSRAVPITKLHIFFNGDNILNETMRGSQKMVAEVNVVEQINGVADMYAENIIRFVRKWNTIEHVHLYGVTGNHGRIGKPGDEDQAANYDRQVYDRLRILLELEYAKGRSRLSNVKFHFHFPRRGETVTATIAGHHFVMHHGDGIRSALGLPIYGLTRLRDRLYKAFRGKMDVLLIGHWHQELEIGDGTIKVIMVPSLVGWNEYSGRMGSGHVAKQNMYLVHPKWGVTIKRTINVGHIKEAYTPPSS